MRKFIFKALLVIVFSLAPNLIMGLVRIYYADRNIPYKINELNRTLTTNVPKVPFEPLYITSITDMSKDTFKNIRVIRDEYGFSNCVPNKKPTILFLGDSFFNNTHVSTDSGIQSKCNMLLGSNLAYNIGFGGCGGFKVYNELMNKHFFEVPKIIICEIVERNLFKWLQLKNELLQNQTKTIDHYYYGIDLVFGNNFKELNKSRIFPANRNFGRKYIIEGRPIYFYHDKLTHTSGENLDRMVSNLLFTQEYFNKKGTKIYFFIAPDKESLYPSIFGKSQMEQIQSTFRSKGINIIDIYPELSQNPAQYYFDGDTHWNIKGVNVFFDALKKTVFQADSATLKI